ncbi:SecDF P1 head subdomain-containing protein [Actinomadura luteofluorescens]|uniref:SecDF P1 head subdomain-containing protein n=1 Tax=Actinomadura luteofluorescens TaxID=46163 RepID=UPI00348E6FD8
MDREVTMRVVPRRNKGRQRDEEPAPAPAPPAPSAEPANPGPALRWPPPPAPLIPEDAAETTAPRPAPPRPPAPVPPGETAPGRTRPMKAGPEPGRDPAEALGQESLRDGGGRSEATTAVLPAATGPLGTEAGRRRARAAQRQREAAEMKRSRAARRQGRAYREAAPARAADQHRSALLVMVLTLGLLIAAVAVTGGMIASSMRTRPVALAAPLHIYPVAQVLPGQCPAGTQGITGQSATGVTCYRLTQGIAIHKVADLRVQKSRVKPGGYDVAVTLRPGDRRAFADLTRATVGRDLAFVVRDRLVTLPRVDMAITDGKVIVTGSPDRPSANALVRQLRG